MDAAGTPAGSATTFSAATLPSGTHMGSVTLAVADLAASARFYDEVLGLRWLEGNDQQAVMGVAGTPLVRLEASEASPRPRGSPGLYHIALLLPDRAALAVWLRHAIDAKVRLQGAADHLVSEAIYLADPEGNGIEVYRDRPRDAWTWDASGVHMTTDPLDADGLLAEATGSGASGSGAVAWEGAPAGTTIGHVHLQVADLEVATRFHTLGLGFEVTTASYPGARFLSAGGYHHHVAVNVWGVRPGARASDARPGSRASDAPRESVGTAGGTPGEGVRVPHLGIQAFQVVVRRADALPAAWTRLREAGFTAELEEGEVRTVTPDGLRVSLVPTRSPGH